MIAAQESKAMISERLRIRAEVKGAADIAAGRKKPEYGKNRKLNGKPPT